MTAYASNDFALPSTEQDTWKRVSSAFDVAPNFNGNSGKRGQFSITGDREVVQGALWSAHYGESAVNTITIQFTAPLQSVSTTVSDYSLSGPTPPTINSVTWNAGARSILLALSGPLISTNTYTLSIRNNAVFTGSSWVIPRSGTYNWPGLVVDVIQPAQIACVNVGIQQDIVVGTPSMQSQGDAQSVGIDQTIDIGTPVTSTSLSSTSIGVDQTITVGDPASGLFASTIAVGVAQNISIGTPAIIQQQEPQGVGIAQTIAVGTPTADINPLTTIGVGILEPISVGAPVVAGPASVIGSGFGQVINVGTPSAVRALDREFLSVGIQQDITIGTPIAAVYIPAIGIGIDQTIDTGLSLVSSITSHTAIGIQQDISVGVPTNNTSIFAVEAGIQQDILIGTPITGIVSNVVGVGSEQSIELGVPAISNQIVATGIEQIINIGTPTITSSTPIVDPLSVTQRQANTFMNLDEALQLAYLYGVQGGVDPDLIAPLQDYNTLLPLQQSQLKLIFKDLAAAAMVALNIPGVFPTTNNNDTASLAKLTTPGAAGSLTFVDGILVSKVNPT
jgi:hypothetical protein